MLRLVDAKGLRNSIPVRLIAIFPARFKFLKGQFVWRVPVDLVGGHGHEWRFGSMLTRSLKQIERAHGVGIKIREGHGSSEVVAWLGRSMHHSVRLELLQKIEHALAVANIELVMYETLNRTLKPVLIPSRVAQGAEKYSALIVINSVNLPAFRCEMQAHFGSDKARRTSYEQFLH